MPTVATIDAQLAGWERDITTATSNLLELEKEQAFESIWGEQPLIVLTGLTKQRAQPLVQDLKDLWQHMGLITRAVKQARDLRRQSRIPADQVLEDIDRLLNASSIQLPPVAIPLQERGLLSAASTSATISAKELLDSMLAAFVKARDVVFAIKNAWRVLKPQLNALKEEADELTALAARLGEQVPELNEFLATFADWSALVMTDPFGVDNRFDLPQPTVTTNQLETKIQSVVVAARDRLVPLSKQRETLERSLAHARLVLIGEIEAVHQECEANHQEVLDAIHEPPAFARSGFTSTRLREWLIKIEMEAQRNLASAAQKFANWSKAVEEFKKVEGEAKDSYKKLLAERQELKARLRMYRTTASGQRYNGANIVEDPDLIRIGAEADQFLARPAQLAEARGRVDAYHSRLRTLELWSKRG